MDSAELCTEDEITQLVHHFYQRVRRDAVLGPIFNAHIDDWDSHLARMVRFWSSLLRRTGTYRGTPMPMHTALPDLDGTLFVRWLALFDDTLAEFDNPAFVAQARDYARRVARSLWYGYQATHYPDRMPTELSNVHSTEY